MDNIKCKTCSDLGYVYAFQDNNIPCPECKGKKENRTMNRTRKLYRVNLRGMKSTIGSGVEYGVSYVVAKDPAAAEAMVKKYLKDEDIGFDSDRELESIELLAEEIKYPDCKHILFIG